MGRLIFLGTSDAFNGAGRANSCYWIEDELGTYAVDFGPTAPMQCAQLGLALDALDGIYLTHLHGDHIGGIAILLVHLHFVAGRERPLVICGPSGTQERLEKLWSSAYPSVLEKGLGLPLSTLSALCPAMWKCWPKASDLRAQHDSFAIASSIRITTDAIDLAFSGDTGWHSPWGPLSRAVISSSVNAQM